MGEDQFKEDWEGYNHESHEDMTDAERPCVDMFDPALRVLGRGSFGRVSTISAGPSFESAVMGQITMELLDVATENFDDTFRRMPIETEDYEKQQLAAGHSPITEKELNEQTFRGFTFDGDELMNNVV
ncbi:hypothetical protein ACHAXN_011024 [Cyclotella atomus]